MWALKSALRVFVGLWDLNFELGVDAVVVLLGTVDDDVLVLHLQ